MLFHYGLQCLSMNIFFDHDQTIFFFHTLYNLWNIIKLFFF